MSTSALKRFRERKLPEKQTVTVSWPLNEPEFAFEVARFAKEEHTAADFNAEKLLKTRGVEAPGPDATKEQNDRYAQERLYATCYCLAEVVKRRTKGWKYLGADGDEVPFSPGNLTILFEEMDYVERALLGLGYVTALREAEEKNDSAPTPSDTSSA